MFFFYVCKSLIYNLYINVKYCYMHSIYVYYGLNMEKSPDAMFAEKLLAQTDERQRGADLRIQIGAPAVRMKDQRLRMFISVFRQWVSSSDCEWAQG